tara:strand:+ start:313 stop:1566 length:1254 start_codon:yes stop_codon:yes gene_type:complete
MKKRMLSLFSGCGGMDIGFEGRFKILKSYLNENLTKKWILSEDKYQYLLKETIFETVFANDIESTGKISWERYFGKRRNIEGIYHLDSIVDLVKKSKKGEFKFPKNIDIVTGGFPCQDFSVSGKRKGFNSNKNHFGNLSDNIPTNETRGKLYMWMKDVIEITKPKMFIAENVKGLINLLNVREIIQNDFSKIGGDGYLVLTPKVLHSGNFGIPQSRQRVFFIGFKKSSLTVKALKELSKIDIEEDRSPYPEITHKINNEINFNNNSLLLKSKVKLSEFLKDLKEPENSSDLSQKYYSKAKFMGSHVQGQTEIKLNGLGPTIRSEHHGNIEFRRLSKENGGKISTEFSLNERRLTLRECSRIQSFPDDYEFVIPSNTNKRKFKLSPSAGYKLVGNAVPPLLAYHISKKIESNWEYYFK